MVNHNLEVNFFACHDHDHNPSFLDWRVVRIVTVELACNGWKSAKFKDEPIVNLPLTVKDK